MFKKYDWLLFDLDNTLLDFSQTSERAFKELLDSFELKDYNELHPLYQKINGKYWHYFEKQKVDANRVRYGRFEEFIKAIDAPIEATKMADKYLELLIKHSFWIAGAEDLLQRLSKTHHLGVITNGLKDAQHARLEKHDMKKYFKHIFISEELGISKPHFEFFNQVHQGISSPEKKKVLVIGDNEHSDIHGALNFEFHACWYNYKKVQKHVSQAHLKVNHWEDLI